MYKDFLKISILAALAAALYFAKGPWFYAAAIVSVIAVNFDRIKNKLPSALIPATAVVLFIFMAMNSFKIYAGGKALFPVIIMGLAFLCVMAVFYLTDYGSLKHTGQFIKPQKVWLYVLKILFGVLLGLCGWYFLKTKNTIVAVMFYAAALVQLIFVFSYDKSICQNENSVFINQVREGAQPDFNLLFSLIMMLIVINKAFIAFTAGNYLEPLMLVMTAAMFIPVIFSSGADVFIKNDYDDNKKLKPADWIIMTVFFIAAMLIRIKWLHLPGSGLDDPPMLWAVVRDCLNTKNIPVVTSDPLILSPVLPFWIIKNFMPFTGGELTTITARLVSALEGSLGVVFMYLIALELFKRRVAVISAAVLSVLFIHLLYSRLTVVNIIGSTMFMTAVLFFLLRAIRKGGVVYWLASGIAMGLGLYTYHAFKIIPLMYTAFIFMVVITSENKRSKLFEVLPGFFLTAVTAFIIFFPVIEYAMKNPDIYFGRLNYASMFKQEMNVSQLIQAFITQFTQISNMLFYANDYDYSGAFCMPGKAILDRSVIFWFLTGFTAILPLWKRREFTLLLLWLLFGAVPALFSWYYSGGAIRFILVVPAIVIIAALGIEFVLGSLEKSLGRAAKLTTPLIAGTILIFICYININEYFTLYLNHPCTKIRWYTGMYRMGENMSKMKNTNYFNSLYYNEQKCVFFSFIQNSLGIKTENIDVPHIRFDKLYNKNEKNAAIVAESMNEEIMQLYKEYFPNAVIKTYYNLEYWMYTNPTKKFTDLYGWKHPSKEAAAYNKANREVIAYDLHPLSKPYIDYTMCYIPYDDIKNLYGLNIFFFKNGSIVSQGVSDGSIHAAGTDCDKVVMKGSINARIYGKYSFEISPAANFEIFIDGIKQNSSRVTLIRGLNRIKIVIRGFDGKSGLTLKIKQPDADEYRTLEYKDVIRSEKIFGLTCKTMCENKTYKSRYYSLRYKYYWWYHDDKEECNYAIREWNGYFNADEAGFYSFKFKTSNEADVLIDGSRVFRTDGKNETISEVMLSKGRHRIRVNETCTYVYYGYPIQLLVQKKGDRAYSEVTYRQLSNE